MDNRYFPLVVVVVMLALGLTLTVADFRRAATLRRPLLVAMLCQSLLLPTLCLLLAEACHLEPKLAVGLMLVSATPGGLMANIISHLVGGDLALNLTLTAINAVLSIFALPAILAVSMTLVPRRRSVHPSTGGQVPRGVRAHSHTHRARRCDTPPVPRAGSATSKAGQVAAAVLLVRRGHRGGSPRAARRCGTTSAY